jgi:antibiotic biosynthesis monooxygenase (ABM) superfamily enzyme
MVTYLVHYTVSHEAYPEYVEFLKNEHINEVMTVPGFLSADLCLRKGGALESSGKEICVVYKVKDEDHIKGYISDFAMKLREKSIEKFPGRFSSQREVWLDTITFASK